MDSGSTDDVEERVKVWNELLLLQAGDFGTNSSEATVLIFSAHQILSEVLENPEDFEFGEDDPTTEGGAIWEDDLHLASEVHDILAERLVAALLPV